MEALIGILSDVPPIIMAVLGGILQQLVGPRRLLMVTAVPSLLSWLVLALWPQSLTSILLSRILAGLGNGLLTGNSYLADMAGNTNRSSLKMVEVSLLYINKELGWNICFYSDDVARQQECWRHPALHSEVNISAQHQSSILFDGGLP